MQPTLLNSSGRAATAAEARFRITARQRVPRSSRVVALDARASDVVAQVAAGDWSAVRFLRCRGAGVGDALADLDLVTGDGRPARLNDELADADFVLLVATASEGAGAAAVIGDACAVRGIMTAGVVLGAPAEIQPTVAALRPYARVLLVTRDPGDVGELLEAVGA